MNLPSLRFGAPGAALLVMLACGSGCRSFPTPEPSLTLKDSRLAEGPVIIQRGTHSYLRYRCALEDNRFGLATVLSVKKTPTAAYYCLSAPISHVEWGNLKERPLAYDSIEELAQSGRIYWMNPDGSAYPIPVRREDDPVRP